MKIAFYAPLNAPDSGKPSGDRLIARMVIGALQSAGHEIELVSRLRSLDKHGDDRRQQRLEEIGRRLAGRLGERLAGRQKQQPAVWLTYHLYHKAPDWIGSQVAARLGIPYILAEASFAPKQAGGHWARGHAGVASALKQADLVIGFNSADAECVKPQLAAPSRYVHLKPFISGAPFREAALNASQHRKNLRTRLGITDDRPVLLAVAMMRDGAKLASYRLLADALAMLGERPWHLAIVGDGPRRREVETAMAHSAARVSFLGQMAPDELPPVYAGADLFVWPAIKEALGMCFLEAQAGGLPVVGSRTLGVPDVVADGQTGLLVPPADAGAFAGAIDSILSDNALRRRFGRAAAEYCAAQHDIETAGRRLAAVIEAQAGIARADCAGAGDRSEAGRR